MIEKITKIIYWKDTNSNLYYIQVEYGKYCEISLLTEEDFEDLKRNYGDLIEEAE
jgi:hypothetical protein